MKIVIYYYCVSIIAVGLFLYGLLPMQQSQTLDRIQLPTSLNDVEFDLSQLYKPEIKRLVLIVIDALRLDFITQDNMPFVVSTYPNEGCILTLRVESPTVTLPRVKALITGGIPQFIDVILNLAATEILKDSLLHQANNAGKKIIFYGDITWIKLYPNMFTRHESVYSYYLSDFTEVDDNVTRNVLKELNNKDWDIMVLHYPGLDHIGHVYGPYSHHVQPKLKEMDDVIKRIHEASKLWDKKTLIIITTDHGMKDSGGHGGSTVSETLVPFIPLGIRCNNDSVAQTDVPVTLASIMGLPHPSSSIGCVISSMLTSTFPLDRLLYILRYNNLFLQSKMKLCQNLFDKASILHYNFLKFHNESDGRQAQKLYERCSKEISEKIVHASIKEDVEGLLINAALLIHSLCAIFYELIRPRTIKRRIEKSERMLVLLLIVLQIIPKLIFVTVASLFIIGLFVLRYIILIVKVLNWKPKGDINSYLILGTVMHSLSLLSSSFIEEEHQVWYFLWGTFILINWYLLAHKLEALKWFVIFLGLRLLRTLNQTGDKWAHLPDFSQWLLLEANYCYLQLLLGLSLILILFCCFHLQGKQKHASIPNAVVLVLIYIFHTWNTESALVKLIWCVILVNLCLGLMQGSSRIERIIITWIMSCTLLMRPYNVILLPACIYASFSIFKFVKNIEAVTISHIWLGNTLYFCQGHSNSLASIDIASGYVGLQDYNPLVVTLQIVCHTYAFPVLANLLLLKYCISNTDNVWRINILCRLLPLTITCIVIVIQRHHLFVWTVFAPKILFEASHSAVLFAELVLFQCIIKYT